MNKNKRLCKNVTITWHNGDKDVWSLPDRLVNDIIDITNNSWNGTVNMQCISDKECDIRILNLRYARRIDIEWEAP